MGTRKDDAKFVTQMASAITPTASASAILPRLAFEILICEYDTGGVAKVSSRLQPGTLFAGTRWHPTVASTVCSPHLCRAVSSPNPSTKSGELRIA